MLGRIRMYTASFTPLAWSSLYHLTILALSQSITWFSFMAWSVIADPHISVSDCLCLSLLYLVPLFTFSVSVLCSFTLTFSFLLVSPTYFFGHPEQSMVYTLWKPLNHCSINLNVNVHSAYPCWTFYWNWFGESTEQNLAWHRRWLILLTAILVCPFGSCMSIINGFLSRVWCTCVTCVEAHCNLVTITFAIRLQQCSCKDAYVTTPELCVWYSQWSVLCYWQG